MFEYATASVLYGEQTLETACREIAGAGIRYIDLWHVGGWCEHLAGGAEAVRETLDRYGLKLEAISAYRTPYEKVPELFETLKELGGSVLVMGSAPPTMTVKEFAEKIAPLVEQAERIGVTLSIENHGHAVIDSIESMVELVRLFPGPGLGITLAPIHLYRRGESTADAIRSLRGKIGLIYIWDWGKSADVYWKDPSEQFLGSGEIDYGPIFEALVEVEYPRPLNIFAHGPEHLPPAETTKRLRKALDVARALEKEARFGARKAGNGRGMR